MVPAASLELPGALPVAATAVAILAVAILLSRQRRSSGGGDGQGMKPIPNPYPFWRCATSEHEVVLVFVWEERAWSAGTLGVCAPSLPCA